jgi:hypothetical protein
MCGQSNVVAATTTLTGGECDIYNTFAGGKTPQLGEAIEMPFLRLWQLQMFTTEPARGAIG